MKSGKVNVKRISTDERKTSMYPMASQSIKRVQMFDRIYVQF